MSTVVIRSKNGNDSLEEIAKLTAELRKKVQEIPRSQTTIEQVRAIEGAEDGIAFFQRTSLLELAQAFDIEITKEFWFPS